MGSSSRACGPIRSQGRTRGQPVGPSMMGPSSRASGPIHCQVYQETSQSAPLWWSPHHGPVGLSTVSTPGASQSGPPWSGPPWSGPHNGKVDVSTASVYPGASQSVPPRWGPHRGPEGLSAARPGSVQGSASRPLHRWGSLFFIHNKYFTVYIILLFNGGKILRRQKLC